MRHIGYLKKKWGTGKDVWVAVDKLLRAKEEGADEDTMISIVRRFWAHQVAKKTGWDEMRLLDFYEACERMKRFQKEQMEWIGRSE